MVILLSSAITLLLLWNNYMLHQSSNFVQSLSNYLEFEAMYNFVAFF